MFRTREWTSTRDSRHPGSVEKPADAAYERMLSEDTLSRDPADDSAKARFPSPVHSCPTRNDHAVAVAVATKTKTTPDEAPPAAKPRKNTSPDAFPSRPMPRLPYLRFGRFKPRKKSTVRPASNGAYW